MSFDQESGGHSGKLHVEQMLFPLNIRQSNHKFYKSKCQTEN